MNSPRVILVDNNVLFRNGLKDTLKTIGNVEIVDVASNGEEFIKIIENKSADIVFIETKMPVMDGFEATDKALKINPNLTIIAFTQFEESCFVKKMIDAGAKGYLSKSKNNIETLKNILGNWKCGYYF